jgi:hypothetical protein
MMAEIPGASVSEQAIEIDLSFRRKNEKDTSFIDVGVVRRSLAGIHGFHGFLGDRRLQFQLQWLFHRLVAGQRELDHIQLAVLL